MQVTAECPVVCECLAEPPSCPPGVSSVPDGCSCCKVCAAQLNQDCHEGRPCDHHKGLECNYGNDVGRTHGICRAKAEGRSCEYNGRIYQNGENFRAGCKHQCTCIDGAVGCVPLCPSHLPLASPSCPAPHLVKVPGQCCLSIDCHRGTTVVPPVYRRPRPPAYPPYPFIPYPAYPYVKPYAKPYQKLYPYKPKKQTDTLGNELVEVGGKWDKLRSHKHLAAWRQVGDQCVVQTTSWSQCSRSCGMGISSRVTNDNARCKLVKESRLCNIRPCSSMSIPAKVRREGSAPEPTRPPSRTACPTPAAEAHGCTGPTTAGCAETAAAAGLVARGPPASPSLAPMASASPDPSCLSSRANAATSATISTRRPCPRSSGSTETHTSSLTIWLTSFQDSTFLSTTFRNINIPTRCSATGTCTDRR
ncbi:CCN family member 1 isoform X2 [Festucalex cinctus]